MAPSPIPVWLMNLIKILAGFLGWLAGSFAFNWLFGQAQQQQQQQQAASMSQLLLTMMMFMPMMMMLPMMFMMMSTMFRGFE